jgi:hypothetical protein
VNTGGCLLADESVRDDQAQTDSKEYSEAQDSCAATFCSLPFPFPDAAWALDFTGFGGKIAFRGCLEVEAAIEGPEPIANVKAEENEKIAVGKHVT